MIISNILVQAQWNIKFISREEEPQAQATNILTGGSYPCNVEAWQLLIKLANDELTHMTNKEMCKFTILFIK